MNITDFLNSRKMILVRGLPKRLAPDTTPVETDGGLYISWVVDQPSVYTFRQGPQFIDTSAVSGTSGVPARIARLTTDLEPWWIAKIEISTEQTGDRVVYVNDIIPLPDDGGCIVIGTLSTAANTPTSGLWSMNFYDADNTIAFNLAKVDKSAFTGFFGKLSATGEWEYVKSIHTTDSGTTVTRGVQCYSGCLLANGNIAIGGQVQFYNGLTSRLYFDETTYITQHVASVSSGQRTWLGFAAVYNPDDGTLVSHQIDAPEADITTPSHILYRSDSNTVFMNQTNADYEIRYAWGGGMSKYSADSGIFHTAAKYGGGGASGADILLDYGNTDLYLPYNREDVNSMVGFVASRTANEVNWANIIDEPGTGLDRNRKMFSNVWTFSDGSCIAIGKSGFVAGDDQNAELRRYPTAITPVEVDANALPYIFAVRYDVDGNVTWSRRIAQYSAVVADLPIFIGDMWEDEVNNIMTFVVGMSSAVTSWSVIDGEGGLHALTTSGAFNKAFLMSIDKDTGAVTHADRIVSNTSGSPVNYAFTMSVNPLTNKTYLMNQMGINFPTENLFPASSNPIVLNPRDVRHSLLIELDANPSPDTPVTNPYTPSRTRELTYNSIDDYSTRVIRPIITTTTYTKAEQYYQFYERRVTAAGGAVVDPVAAQAFVTFMVNNDIWLSLSSAFLPFGGFIKDIDGLVSTWFNMHGPDVLATLTARPVWTATDAAFNNLPSIAFDGTNDILAATAQRQTQYENIFLQADQFEAYAVFNADAINTNTNGSNDPLVQVTVAGLELNSVPRMQIFNNDGTVDVAASVITTGATYLAHGRHEDSLVISSINGGAETSAASGNVNSANVTALNIGGRSGAFFDGKLSLILTFREVLSTTQRTALTAYLKELYNIA